MTTLTTPYTDDGTWLRGNLHAHSTGSDGARDPDLVIADYSARGYEFLAISDHDVFTDPAEYHDESGIVLLPAVEVSRGTPHTLHIGASEAMDDHDGPQSIVDWIRDDDGLAILAHPNWQEEFAHWRHEVLEQTEGYDGIEIYNGLIEHHPGAALATDRWDRLLSAGRRVWGYANDDSHRPWEVARGWNVVQVEERTPSAIFDALATGQFYASTGVTVETVQVSGGEITVETTNADRLRLVSDHGVVQQTVDGRAATFRVPEQLVHRSGHTYVRVECVGRGGDMAWLQPMFLTESEDTARS